MLLFRHAINDSFITIITIIIKIIKMHVINSGATLISQNLNDVHKSADFHDDFRSKF